MCRAIRPLILAALALALAACEVVSAPLPGPDTGAPVAAPSAQLPPAPSIPAPVLLQRALAARTAADDEAAAADLSALLQAHPDAPEAAQARYYLAERYAARGRWTSAAELLGVLLAAAPAGDPLRPPALFWLARAHEAAGDHGAAAAAYAEYRALETPIAPYAAARQAAQEQALGRAEGAAASYLAAARSEIVRGERAGAIEKAIALLEGAGRPAEALALYPELLALADEPAYRARVLASAAALAEAQGQGERARSWRAELLASAPATPQAAAAADLLIAAGGQAVAPSQAARAYLAAERWAEALAQLDLALAAEGDPAARAELGRQRGLALRAQGDFPGALAALAEAAAADPDGEAGREAQLAWVQTVGQSGETGRAVQGYEEYAAAYPDDPRASVALDRAAQLRDRLGDAEGALQARLALGRRYPASDAGRAALHQAGLALLAAGRPMEARQAWQALAEGNSGSWRGRGAYWAGRAARAYGDERAARDLFAAARAAAPDTYEGARAAEELGAVPQGDLPIGAPIAEEEWAALAGWAAAAEAGAPGAGAAEPAAPDGLDARAARARLLAEVGLQAEAVAEWLEGVALAEGRPAQLAAIARAAHEAGVPYAALMAADALADQAPAGAGPQPTALRRLLFPTPYPELVRREAAERGLDPRLLYALFRQESLFNPGATSWVGARGLGQVMPETGQGIAQNLGVADFVLDDLYRPAVSIRFGAFYLGRRVEDMGGSVHGALAAYNGGLGNAQRWAGGSAVPDPDAFTETIDYPETKGYVRAVYGFWGVYQGLYAP